jgi:hypothetical protein
LDLSVGVNWNNLYVWVTSRKHPKDFIRRTGLSSAQPKPYELAIQSSGFNAVELNETARSLLKKRLQLGSDYF